MTVGAQRPRLWNLPSAAVGSSGPDAVEFAVANGYKLDDFQVWCIHGILSEDENYRLCATLCVLILPRQNGKNVVLEVIELYVFYVLGWPVILHTAHRQDTSADHMARLRSVIEANPELDAITEFRAANGKERIFRTDTRAEIRFVTRTKKIGRGRSPRLVVFDEALYLTDEQIQAIIPSLSAQSMRDDLPLMIYTSSAPIAESLVLHRVRDACIAKLSPATTFFAEWSCEPDVDPADRRAWYAANPGMGVRISEQWVFDNEFVLMMTEAFMVERLGVPVFPPSSVAPDVKIPADRWAATLILNPPTVVPGECSMAYDVHNDWSAVSVAAGTLGLSYVEVVRWQKGIAWLPVQMVELVSKWKPTAVGFDGGCGPAAAVSGEIREALELAGLDPDLVQPRTLSQYKADCGSFYQGVIDLKVKRPTVAPDQLETAGANASERRIGVDGAFVWNRQSAEPLATLVSATVARALLPTEAPKEPPKLARLVSL